MFNGKKLMAVSGLLGGLVMTCLGATQAHAATPGACTLDAQGNIICTQQLQGQTPEGDGFVLRRTVNCQPSKPLTLPTPGVLSNGQTRIGPNITCADSDTPMTTTAPSSQDNEPDAASPLIARLLG